MPPAFDPASCALFAHIVEQTAATLLCPIRRPRVMPHARRWLRLNSERALEAVMEDITESALDAVNTIDPRLAVGLILILWLRVVTVAQEDDC